MELTVVQLVQGQPPKIQNNSKQSTIYSEVYKNRASKRHFNMVKLGLSRISGGSLLHNK